MKIHSKELLEEFHKEVDEDFPGLTTQQIREIAYGPWKYLKAQMESGSLITVRFKYFGTFTVYEGRARGLLERLKKRFQEHGIEPDEYFRIKTMLEDYLNKKDEEEGS